jgi:hypothetical protein
MTHLRHASGGLYRTCTVPAETSATEPQTMQALGLSSPGMGSGLADHFRHCFENLRRCTNGRRMACTTADAVPGAQNDIAGTGDADLTRLY